MQASSRWSPPGGTLGTIVKEAGERASALRRDHGPRLGASLRDLPKPPSLAVALRSASVGVLAEVKRRSPSKGDIAPALDPVDQARAYQDGGAAGVSILTEPRHFGGSADDLAAVRAHVDLPILKKDFHVDVIQLVEARVLGASAALLIARALHPDLLVSLVDEGRALGLELLVEVRDEAELETAIRAKASMIGVNNRNLETLVIDPATCDRLIPLIPTDAVAVAESGVQSRAHVERYAAIGADAVLVGSVLSASADPARATRELTGVSRRARGRS
ncbi:MAG TPA: indole-3-glycerol phosphate synthase TrpC [Gemmatimonadaceae bacterium]|nr:indole-3-glycerol phosphate synthase TrpC [Gemmatimonadaceae bacterium]